MINMYNTHLLTTKFVYHAPSSLDEAFKLLETYRGDVKLLAGGTDLIPQLKMRRVEPGHIINLKRIPNLSGIKINNGSIYIGALTRLRDIEKSKIIEEKLPLLTETVKAMASIQVRNMGTIGGNLCNASPAGDMSVSLIALGAKVQIACSKGIRSVPCEEFFTGPGKTIMSDNEILTGISITIKTGKYGSSFIKVGRVVLDLATVNAAVSLTIDSGKINEVCIAIGAVAPTPLRLHAVENYLIGKSPSFEVFMAAGNLVSETIKPITDVRSTAEYRKAVSKTIIMDALDRAYRLAGGQ